MAGYHQWILPIAKLGGLGRAVGASAFRLYFAIWIFLYFVFDLTWINYSFWQVLSIDCLITGEPSNHDPSIFYLKALMHAFVPPLCAFASGVVMCALAYYLIRYQGDERHWWTIVRDKWITATIVTVFFMHPAVCVMDLCVLRSWHCNYIES
jgi:hypothetical protein